MKIGNFIVESLTFRCFSFIFLLFEMNFYYEFIYLKFLYNLYCTLLLWTNFSFFAVQSKHRLERQRIGIVLTFRGSTIFRANSDRLAALVQSFVTRYRYNAV